MNKKDVSHIRNQFKRQNDHLQIEEIYNVYVMKESSEIYHEQTRPFERLEEDEQTLFLTNFKKLLAGQLDQKLFELSFNTGGEDSAQQRLYQALSTDDKETWQSHMKNMAKKLLDARQYETDVVITFIKASYTKPTRSRTDETAEDEFDSTYNHPFILCTINQTQDPKKELHFDYAEKAFKYNVVVDPVINLDKPIGGFLYPCFVDHAQDVNRVLYSVGQSKEIDLTFVEDVLDAKEPTTASEDKFTFEEIVRDAYGYEMNTDNLASMYESIQRTIETYEETDEEPVLDYKDIGEVLHYSGLPDVDPDKVKTAFENVTDNEQHELKARNIVPKYNQKSIKIDTKVAKVAISPEDLRHVKQVQMNGRRYLMIEVEENTVIDGFTMIPEAFGQKDSNDDQSQ
ncbi:protein of unknown function [Pelagirhabdus alkalitolerans]|uniref:DUF4317 family protein n=1 Tax=Pelagirhabdus alkalitolerans TaxID=1612202 RepID=A0A1G6GMN4_9BACI|nr:DUF4317 domain-containing protein [Pelagirhabdus alkalitolerans]SDB83227.1 protein of unknown function [Pelagirhabdus alkalitolerans]